MSLKPPIDYSKPLLCAAIGVTVALVGAVLRADNLPRVGDNIHSLPHGGLYRDGTKSVNYNGLNCIEKSNIDPFYTSHKFIAFCVVCLLSFLIYVCSQCNRRSGSIHHHCVHHHSS
uniref:Movement protein TGB2 n=1 Tax=Cherry rusty mottle associated virus TaxID=1312929 RepID=A0A0U2D8D8_9VIRU|nr:triple gene block protein 2 [Cherry rusty mottle associated virus]